MELPSTERNYYQIINIFIQEDRRLITFENMLTVLSPPFSYSLHRVLCLIFVFFPFHMNSVCTLFNKLIIDVGILVAHTKSIIFEISNDL